MEDSVPLRRSTRNSVALKNEELTPRKRKVSTPVKVEPSTPSRRTRASSATPKKNLIETINTPKKALPVLNEEENSVSTNRTPVKKTKEISPKTPSRRRLVRESVSTPTRVSIDKSTKKPVDTSEEINVTANRPLTRAKRKTMGAIPVVEVTETSESEKAVQNKKDIPESDTSLQKKKETSTISSIDDNTNKSPVSKIEEESSLALVPKVVVTDFKKQQSKESKGVEDTAGEENECGTFTSKSPVRAEDVVIKSPRKVPKNCKSISEASLISDPDYINSKSQNVAKDTSNSTSSVEKTDISSVEDLIPKSSINTTTVPDILITSPKKVENSKDIDASNVPTSTEKVIDSKDNDIPNIIITSPSPQKVSQPKIIDIVNIAVTSPSPQKGSGSKDNDKNGSVSSEQNSSPRKNETNSSVDAKENDICEPTKSETFTSVNIESEVSNKEDVKERINLDNESTSEEVNTSSPQKINENNKYCVEEKNEVSEKSNEENTDENSKTIVQADINNSSSTKTDFQNDENKEVKLILSTSDTEISSLHCQSPKEDDAVENVISDDTNEENTVQSAMHVSSDEVPLVIKEKGTDVERTEIENKDSEELNKTFGKVESDDIIPSSAENEDVSAEKLSQSDSQVLTDKNNVAETVSDADKAVMKDDVTPLKNENSNEINESKLISPADDSFELNISDLDENDAEDNPEEVNTITSVIPAIEEPVITPVEDEKSEKDESNASETGPSSTDETACSPSKTTSSEVVISKASEEDKKINEIPSSTNENIENNREKVDESLKTAIDESSPVRHNDASSSDQSDTDEVKSMIENEDGSGAVVREGIINPPRSPSPIVLINCDCDTSDSGDSGILNDKRVLIFKVNPRFKETQLKEGIVKLKRNEAKIHEAFNKYMAAGSGTSNISSVGNVENNHDIPLAVEDKKKPITEYSLESSGTTSLDETLMSANEFLNSEDENSMDCEKVEESESKCDRKSSNENEPSVDLTRTDVDHAKDPRSETEDSVSFNVTLGDGSYSEEISTDVDKKQDDCVDLKKSNSFIDEKNDSEVIKTKMVEEKSLNDSETMNSPGKTIKLESLDNSEAKNSRGKNDEQEGLNDSETKNSPGKNEQKSINDLETINSPGKAEQENLNDSQTMKSPSKAEKKTLNDSHAMISPRKAEQNSFNDSQIISSPKLKVENFADKSDSSEFIDDESDSSVMVESVNLNFAKKSTKSKNKKGSVNKQSESEGSQSADSELSDSAQSNAATEGSSDGPLTGKDFIDFEAEEGEETSEDDSFIVSSEESSSSSDVPNFNMKLRKRKRNLDNLNPDGNDYIDHVETLVDSSKDDTQQDKIIKNKKQKLEKIVTVDKKKQKPKSILRNKETIIESAKNRNRDKSKTGNKVIKELSKIGIFSISSISENFEEQKLPRKSSKFRKEQKKSIIPQFDCVPMGFDVVNDIGKNVVDDAALRDFVVSYDESYLVAKKPRKAVNNCLELISKKKKIKEGKTVKKSVKKSLCSESKVGIKTEEVSPFAVTLILPSGMNSEDITSILEGVGINDICSINFPRPKVATVEFSKKEPFEKILEMYGEIKYCNRPIYVLKSVTAV